MPAWNKARFDEAYEFFPEARLGLGHPNTRLEVSLHYHEWAMKPIIIARWRGVLEVLAIAASDKVLIIGAGFGWGVSELKSKTGCTAIGTDDSAHIQNAKDSDDSEEIKAAITVVGLDPATGRGLEIMNAVCVAGDRAKEVVLDEDMASGASWDRIGSALGGEPTWLVVEDAVDDSWTDADIVTLAGNLDNKTAQKVWLYSPTPTRSVADLEALTGHQVLGIDTLGALGGADLKKAEKPIIDQDDGIVG